MNINELFESVDILNISEHHANFNVCLHTPPHIVSDGIWGGHITEAPPLRSSFSFSLSSLHLPLL